MQTDIFPLGDRVLVRPLKAEEKSKGGIIIPDAAREKPKEAEVVSVGAGRIGGNGQLIPVAVKVGELVIFSKFSGIEFRHGDTDFLVLKEDECIAVIRKSEVKRGHA